MLDYVLMILFGLCGIILTIYIPKSFPIHENDYKLTNFELLLSACFDDQIEALRLVQLEKQKDNSISDEEAAGRALNLLLSQVREKREAIIKAKRTNSNLHAH